MLLNALVTLYVVFCGMFVVKMILDIRDTNRKILENKLKIAHAEGWLECSKKSEDLVNAAVRAENSSTILAVLKYTVVVDTEGFTAYLKEKGYNVRSE